MGIYRVIVIDPTDASVREEQWNSATLEQIYKWIGADTLDHASGPARKGVQGIAWVDDSGLLKGLPRWKMDWFYHSPLAGTAVIFGGRVRSGNTTDVPYTVEEIKNTIRFERIIPDWIGGTA